VVQAHLEVPTTLLPSDLLGGGDTVGQLLTRDVVVSALARDLQVGWRTLWKAIEGPLEQRLKELADQASVEALGLDEHVWRHSGPHKNRMITGVVDHTRPPRDANGKTKPFARLLDVQVGRSGAVAEDWLASQGKEFTSKIRIAAIDPYRGYANAISATLKEADMVVDIFHVTKRLFTIQGVAGVWVWLACRGGCEGRGLPMMGVPTQPI